MGSPVHYKYIDALRGCAFLGVLSVHTAYQVRGTPFEEIALAGRFGVQLFFLLSAVTLLGSMAARTAREHFPVRNFFFRRFFRIAPLFWFGIVFYLLVSGTGPRHWAPNGLRYWHIILTALFSHAWTPTSLNSVVPGGWSIAVEMTFYVLLPFLARWITSARSALVVAGCSLASSVLLNWLLTPVITHMVRANEHYLIPSFLTYWFPTQFPVFLLGFAVYYCIQNRTVMQSLAAPRRAAILLTGAVVVLLALCFVNPDPLFPLAFCFSIPLGAVIIALAARPFPIVVNPLLCRLGTISFSCYIMHFTALLITYHLFNAAQFAFLPPALAALSQYGVAWIVALALTVAMSVATYFLIEKPGIKLGNLIIRRAEASTGTNSVIATPSPIPRGEPSVES